MLGVGATLVGLRDTVYSLIFPQKPEDAVRQYRNIFHTFITKAHVFFNHNGVV